MDNETYLNRYLEMQDLFHELEEEEQENAVTAITAASELPF
jgi:hypothetical protein